MAATGRKMLSTVHKGLAFEQRALSLLTNNLSMSLTSVAGRGDGGIDLQGWWWLPQLTPAGSLSTADTKQSSEGVYGSASLLATQDLMRRKVRVIAQCKAESRKPVRWRTPHSDCGNFDIGIPVYQGFHSSCDVVTNTFPIAASSSAVGDIRFQRKKY
ncbi:hypothetical protein FS837_011386 [Tulasnella sp. UAMH 9824]|nr:hypothetical protein FS837_011386 [Tulasnella sp. UAMH 9824]